MSSDPCRGSEGLREMMWGSSDEVYVWVGLGSNLADPTKQLSRARAALRALTRSPLLQSRLYQSAPWGYQEQPPFINQVVGLKPFLARPILLLRELLEIERTLGRVRGLRWGPRLIDLDLLHWPGHQLQSAELTLPHPEIIHRRFVLQPWVELSPDLVLPGHERSLQELLARCPDDGALEPLEAEANEGRSPSLSRQDSPSSHEESPSSSPPQEQREP